MQPTHVDLFSGIGGFSLAAKWAGFRTVLHCEIDPYCQKVLRKNFPEVPIHDDIHTLDGSAVGAVDLVTGGFPCQPWSAAGNRRGDDDPRHLWPAMFVVIESMRPCWVVAENVSQFAHDGLDDVVDDLDRADYETRTFLFPASAVAARHERYRTFVIAHAAGAIRQRRARGASRQSMAIPKRDGGEWPDESCVDRIAHGIPCRVDRLHALGNAVVPQQVYPILAAIAAQL